MFFICCVALDSVSDWANWKEALKNDLQIVNVAIYDDEIESLNRQLSAAEKESLKSTLGRFREEALP